MKIGGRAWRTVWELPDADGIEVIDQRALPHRVATATLRTPDAVATAIRDMYVRGAPLIGAVAAYGVYLATLRAPDAAFADEVAAAAERLLASRPTAVNLRWAVRFVLDRVKSARSADEAPHAAPVAARHAVAAQLERSRPIGEAGLPLSRVGARQQRRAP